MKESFTLEVKRPVREVFERLTDLDQLAAMSGGKVAVSPVADRPRRGKGAAVLLTPQVPGADAGAVLCETLEWDPPSLCTRRFAIKDLPTTASFRLDECAAGTRVTVDIELEPQSLMYKMMLPALALKLKSDKEKFVAHLQAELAKLEGPDEASPQTR